MFLLILYQEQYITTDSAMNPTESKPSPHNGGDKRNQTADLLNAMPAIRGQNEFQCIL